MTKITNPIVSAGFIILILVLVMQSLQAAPEKGGGFQSPVMIEAPTLPDGADNLADPPANPAATYFPVFPADAAADAPPSYIPITSNQPTSGDHSAITRGIIIIHDISRDASAALGLMTSLAGENNAHTIIIAPQFLLGSDISRYADRLPNSGHDIVHWGFGSWEDGGDSVAPAGQKGVSSFTVIDLLILFMAEKTYFPNLKEIIVTGHGAGGDFVMRYAAAGKAPDILDLPAPAVRFVALNASSYLYLTQSRPLPTNKPGFAPPDAGKCPSFDHYKYGLEELNTYAGSVGANAIRLRYPSRSISYLVGEKVQNDDHYPDQSCAAKLQGENRLVRAMNYDLYLNTIFSGQIDQQHFVTVPNVGYDPQGLYGSRCGVAVIFGNGTCNEPVITGAKTRL